jgi:hypothetical protein
MGQAEASSPHGGKEIGQEGVGDKIPPTRTNPSDILPLTRSQLLKFPEPPKIAPSARDHVFNT